MRYYVYIHTSPSKKRYIGITTQEPEKRWLNGNGYKKNKHFYAAIKKYGWKNFKHQVFEVPNEQAMYDNEKELIELFRTTESKYGYNHSTGGEKSGAGVKPSEETLKKMSKSQSGEKNGMYGKTHSDEAKQKMSKAKKGKTLSEDHKRKLSESRKGEKNGNSKKVEINGIVYNTCTEAAHTFSVPKSRISRWIRYGKAKIV